MIDVDSIRRRVMIPLLNEWYGEIKSSKRPTVPADLGEDELAHLKDIQHQSGTHNLARTWRWLGPDEEKVMGSLPVVVYPEVNTSAT